jgi:hypothetical protein
MLLAVGCLDGLLWLADDDGSVWVLIPAYETLHQNDTELIHVKEIT